jgi:hypothetical protein
MKTGRELWEEELPRNRNKYYASPVLAGDTLYCTREDGIVFVCKLKENGLEVVSENDMGEKVIATPAPVRNGLLVRGEKHLFRIDSQDTKVASTRGSKR